LGSVEAHHLRLDSDAGRSRLTEPVGEAQL
jgi:hypothetical protein